MFISVTIFFVNRTLNIRSFMYLGAPIDVIMHYHSL